MRQAASDAEMSTAKKLALELEAAQLMWSENDSDKSIRTARHVARAIEASGHKHDDELVHCASSCCQLMALWLTDSAAS